MARTKRPVRLRAPTRGEKNTLRKKLKDLTLSARIHQRYRIIDLASKSYPTVEIAERVGCHFTVAYNWIRRFNQNGFETFERVSNPKGRPPILQAQQLRELVDVALSDPSERGLPFTAWSVAKLAEYCRSKRLLPEISDEWVRRVLRREGITAQRTRTWKTSSDPQFDAKKNASGRSTGSARRTRR